MSIQFKEGVDASGIRPELVLGLTVCSGVFDSFDSNCTITSLTEGEHSHTSLHYSGQAADLRIWGLEGRVELLASRIRSALGNNPDYDVVVERDHIHFEFQPKRK